MAFSFTAPWATLIKRGIMSYFLDIYAEMEVGKNKRNILVDLLCNILLKRQQP